MKARHPIVAAAALAALAHAPPLAAVAAAAQQDGKEAAAPAAAAPAAAAPSADTPEARAQVLFDESRKLYSEQNFEEAVKKLQEAYLLVPSSALLYNTAKCYEKIGDYGQAVGFYERYLKESVGAPDADTVRELIAHYRGKMATSGTPSSPEERAAQIANKGRDYYRAGRFADAIAQLESANRVSERSAFIYNIAKCYEKMGEYDQALIYFSRYLAMEPAATDRSDVEAIIKSLQDRMRESLSELMVRTVPAGADVYIDDMSKLRGQSPLELRLPPGDHKIVLQKNGFESIERDFDMPEDRPRDLAYALVKVKNFGGLALDSNVNGAQIVRDGCIRARTPYDTTKLVEQGRHQVTVRRDGYYLYQADVSIEKGKLTKVQANLPERGQMTGWMTTLGGWVAGVTAGVGLVTAVTAYWLGDYAVRGTDLGENAWIAQQVGMYTGLAGVLTGGTLIALDLIIQPDDVYDTIDAASDILPKELDKEDDVSTVEEVRYE